MKYKNRSISFLVACLLAVSLASCGQIENGTSSSAGTSSSQPESSVSQTNEESSSLPEESSSLPEPTSQNSEPTESFDEAQTATFEVIDGRLIDHIGYETFEPWMQQMENEHKTINIQNFVEQFQIDRATLESILPNTYTPEQLDALYSGDETAILKAFQLPEGYSID